MTNSHHSDEDRRKHLDFIQAVVTRMSTASSTSKSWALPIVTATYGYALTQEVASVALLGIISVILFGFLDANYLNQERKYRALYDSVAGLGAAGNATNTIPPFSMDPSEAEERREKNNGEFFLVALGRRWFPSPKVWSSWSIAPFYGVLLLVGVFILVYIPLTPSACN